MGSIESTSIDNHSDEGIEVGNRIPIADLWSFDAQLFGLTVDTLTTGALPIDRLIEWACSIKRDPHQAATLDSDMLDAAFRLVVELLVLTGSPFLRRREEEGTAIQVRSIAVAMCKLIGRMHTQPFRAQRHAVRVTFKGRVPVLILGHRRNAPMQGRFLLHRPGIKGGISGQMGGELLQSEHHLLRERLKRGDNAGQSRFIAVRAVLINNTVTIFAFTRPDISSSSKVVGGHKSWALP